MVIYNVNCKNSIRTSFLHHGLEIYHNNLRMSDIQWYDNCHREPRHGFESANAPQFVGLPCR